jgi:DeoR/GlpR family transcriptional regulator of sugar metabolism
MSVVRGTPLADHRQKLILSALRVNGECRVSDLARQFQLSEMTVRRDLQVLEARGMLKRVHGGAVMADRDVIYQIRAQMGLSQKQQIGRAAARLIHSGQSIYLDAGTTSLEIARAIRSNLPEITHLTIVTHGINIANELSGQTPHRLILIGGEVYQNAFSTVGPAAEAQVLSRQYDIFFMAAGGVDLETGWSNTNFAEAVIKRAALAQSRVTYAVADSSKWASPLQVSVCPFESAKKWLVDRELPASAMAAADAAGIEMVFADE